MALFDKIVLIYVCIAVACIFYRPDIIIGEQNEGILSVLNINQINLSNLNWSTDASSAESSLFRTGSDAASNPIQSFIDGLLNGLEYIKIFWRAIFSPFYILFTIGIPNTLLWIIAIPLIMLMLLGIILAIRGLS